MIKILSKLFSLILLFVIVYSLINILTPAQNDAVSQVTGEQNHYGPDIKRTCGTMDLLDLTYKANPQYKDVISGLNNYIEDYTKQHPVKDNAVVTIPVVVHVVYYTALQNISYEQIISQINVLNKDFRRRNADTNNTPVPFKPVAGDPQVEFCLAKRDPSGSPTLGITRTQTTITSFGLDQSVKFTSMGGHDVWDRNQYLNLWVCNLGSNLLGYATFPGGNPATDGVVIGYQYFGTVGVVSPPYNLGRTASHEVGHWLALYHIWGDDNGACYGSDEVDDTPNQGPENYSCPGYPHVSCSNGPYGDMFMNYMDYTNDGCMNIFTLGQIARMSATLNGPRLPLLSSSGCSPVSGVPICFFSSDSTVIRLGGTIHFEDKSAGIPTSWNWTFTGGNPSSSTQRDPVVNYSTPGLYTVKLIVSNTHGTDSLVRTGYIRVLGAMMNAFTLVSPPMNTRISTSPGNIALENFYWTRSSTAPQVTYKFKIRKMTGQSDILFSSNNSGADTVIGIRNNLLDSIADIFGITGDSVRCIWRVTAYNGVDSLSSNSLILTLVRSVIGIEQISSSVPAQYSLYNNYPNPFNPTTKIKFDVPSEVRNQKSEVRLIIFDILGRQVAVIVNDKLSPGKYEVTWDASLLSSGVYFYRMETERFIDTKKMLLVK
ncbi:MAG: T9SS C-terminal target domain-containing protein [Ignavibacteriae bacterium]|nr:MAG: T9SS C-terminal target domain-containing protein [Ignavibacteriota bacterium]